LQHHLKDGDKEDKSHAAAILQNKENLKAEKILAQEDFQLYEALNLLKALNAARTVS
jgi:hypothetical protein